MTLTFTLPFQLPALNDLIDSKARTRGNWNAYNDMKQRYSHDIQTMIRISYGRSVPKIPAGSVVSIEFAWREPDRRRDPDNIAAAGTKLILDCMQAMGMIESDGWSLYTNETRAIFSHAFSVDAKNVGVTVCIFYRGSRV